MYGVRTNIGCAVIIMFVSNLYHYWRPALYNHTDLSHSWMTHQTLELPRLLYLEPTKETQKMFQIIYPCSILLLLTHRYCRFRTDAHPRIRPVYRACILLSYQGTDNSPYRPLLGLSSLLAARIKSAVHLIKNLQKKRFTSLRRGPLKTTKWDALYGPSSHLHGLDVGFIDCSILRTFSSSIRMHQVADPDLSNARLVPLRVYRTTQSDENFVCLFVYLFTCLEGNLKVKTKTKGLQHLHFL